MAALSAASNEEDFSKILSQISPQASYIDEEEEVSISPRNYEVDEGSSWEFTGATRDFWNFTKISPLVSRSKPQSTFMRTGAKSWRVDIQQRFLSGNAYAKDSNESLKREGLAAIRTHDLNLEQCIHAANYILAERICREGPFGPIVALEHLLHGMVLQLIAGVVMSGKGDATVVNQIHGSSAPIPAKEGAHACP
ncbi:hypothetical protein VNO77_44053 [Canavalia gladiata]|uniref:Uncharacterized protein n=1 Tax=Canavalia gladiata TaxID=3824 RepID=A0AAN9JVY7_CANGL